MRKERAHTSAVWCQNGVLLFKVLNTNNSQTDKKNNARDYEFEMHQVHKRERESVHGRSSEITYKLKVSTGHYSRLPKWNSIYVVYQLNNR